ncbi:MAG TPA: prolyl oligopeptidase family serine peptidase [bacterium]|nr:prolyl oligopeptidase family serine peptidase [bacterium]HOL65925.1 prolyl oligopeptidase family serine peptidase [bacterium]HPP11322.1 prolyl oligopeptidase family serine peptidase [bacterium]
MKSWIKIAAACFLIITGRLFAQAGEQEFSFTSSYDGSRQLACAYIPQNYQGHPAPLLVVAHYMNGNRYTARASNYYQECDRRNWLLVCPELHGKKTDGKTSFAALPAQHDLLDAITWMKANYRVDTSRIYLTGRSMGGLLAALMAAKHPHLFAAVVAGQAISDLKLWVRENPHLGVSVEKECGPLTPENEFEYARRSPINYAPNFRYVPLILWHGTEDRVVSPSHSLSLAEAIRKIWAFQENIFWMVGGGHNATNFPAAWVCDRLQYYQNTSDVKTAAGTRFYEELNFVTDEAGSFFWIKVEPATGEDFVRVRARLDKEKLLLETNKAAGIEVDFSALPRGTHLKEALVSNDLDLKVDLVYSENAKQCFRIKPGNQNKLNLNSGGGL